MVHTYNRILLSNRKENSVICYNMDESWGHQFSSVQSLSCVRLFTTPQTAARQAPLSMGFSRQEYWSGWPCPPPGDLPDPRIKPWSPATAGGFFMIKTPGNPRVINTS